MILNDPNLPTLENFVYDTNIKTLITETRFICFFIMLVLCNDFYSQLVLNKMLSQANLGFKKYYL